MTTVRRPTRSLHARASLAMIAILVVAMAACGPTATVEIGNGKPVPNITGTSLDGATVDLSALRGHPVLINFWGPSCEPCRLEMPLLAKKAAEHAAAGFIIVGVLTDDPVEPARKFESDFGATWQTVIDPGGAIKSAYRVLSRPQSYFVDAAGVLRSIQIGYLTDADFERQLAPIVAGP